MSSRVRIEPATTDPDELGEQARAALASGEEQAAIPKVRAGAEQHKSALLWQWTGLLQRAIDEHQDALESLAEAARLAPGDARIAHARARTAMEAGLPAVALFEQARTLAPLDGSVLLGLAAARAAVGDGERAATELDTALAGSPKWLVGHEQLAQLLATLGRAESATASLDQALTRFPAAPALWETKLSIQLRRGAYDSLRDIVARARAAGVRSAEFAIYEAIWAAEFDPETYPPALFDHAPPGTDQALDSWRVRHLLRVGAVDAALPVIDRALANNQAEVWAYAATAWRMADDPRSAWIEGDPRMVQIIDLAEALSPIEPLADTLRALHVLKGEYLDQSVRGGTQTDGPLFSRVDPTIRRLRAVIVDAVQSYVDQLPPPDPRHPLLRQRRNRRIRFAGSWSVRLRSGGHHSNHVHPRGWISSALYVGLPASAPGEPTDAGWLTLGEPDDKLGLVMPPWRKIEPKPGRLVLFPSFMWHGTVPFRDGERLTVAFDVAPPV